MYIYRIYELDGTGKVASRHDISVDASAADAIDKAREMAEECVVELWCGGNLLATFRPDDSDERIKV